MLGKVYVLAVFDRNGEHQYCIRKGRNSNVSAYTTLGEAMRGYKQSHNKRNGEHLGDGEYIEILEMKISKIVDREVINNG